MQPFSYDHSGLFAHYSIDYHPVDENFFMHAHECYELYYFLSGHAVFWVEGTPYPLRSDDIMIFNIAETHRISVQSDVPYERAAVLFNSAMLDQVDPEHTLLTPFCSRTLGHDNRFHSSDFRDGYWKHCLTNMFSEAENRRLQISVNLLPLLNELNYAFSNKKGKSGDNQDDMPQLIVQYINENIFDFLSADEVACKFSISKSSLFAMMKKTTGTTFWNYITIKRLLYARQQLLMGHKPMEVYARCGFQDYTTFYRAYRSKFGTSPKQVFSQLTTEWMHHKEEAL